MQEFVAPSSKKRTIDLMTKDENAEA